MSLALWQAATADKEQLQTELSDSMQQAEVPVQTSVPWRESMQGGLRPLGNASVDQHGAIKNDGSTRISSWLRVASDVSECSCICGDT